MALNLNKVESPLIRDPLCQFDCYLPSGSEERLQRDRWTKTGNQKSSLELSTQLSYKVFALIPMHLRSYEMVQNKRRSSCRSIAGTKRKNGHNDGKEYGVRFKIEPLGGRSGWGTPSSFSAPLIYFIIQLVPISLEMQRNRICCSSMNND